MQSSSSTSPSSLPSNDNTIKRRRRLLPTESEFLVKLFEHYPRPTAPMREVLARQLGMSPRGIQIWFQNKRAKVKRDMMESGQCMLLFAPPISPYGFGDLFGNDGTDGGDTGWSEETSPKIQGKMESRFESLGLPTVEQLEEILQDAPDYTIPRDFEFLNLP